jgi:hypothetical protein
VLAPRRISLGFKVNHYLWFPDDFPSSYCTKDFVMRTRLRVHNWRTEVCPKNRKEDVGIFDLQILVYMALRSFGVKARKGVRSPSSDIDAKA